ncbi:hypothetical protein MMC12_005424 [Toensbergia leucococca]|nr:hypothetical protein [Toensbergia leucococca]
MTSKPRTPSWLHKLFRPTPPSTPTPSTSKLEKLPPEILSQITAYLPSSSRQILSITSRTLYRAIPPSYCILTRCAKYAVLCTLITSGLVKEKNLYACCLCKTRHSKQKFYPRAGHRGACGELGRDMLSRGPAERFCELHFPQTVAKLQDAEHDRWELREQRASARIVKDQW